MKITICLLLPVVLSSIIACTEVKDAKIYSPEHDTGVEPVISSMDPADSSYAGVGTITLSGENFTVRTPYKEYNQVYFDEVQAEILEVTATRIVVESPKYIADEINVKVATRDSEPFSNKVKYKLKAAVDTTFGDLDNLPKPHVIYGMASDLEGNLYFSAMIQDDQRRGTLKKIDRSGKLYTIIDETDYLKANTMRYGPDNKLYLAVVLGRPKQIRVVDPETGMEEILANLSTIPRDMDFDMQDNLWVVGLTDLSRVKPDGTVDNMATYPVDLNTIKIFEDDGITYLYVAGYNDETGEHKIWRQEIKNDGSLAEPEVFLDLETIGWLDEGIVTAITFSQDGRMFLGTTQSPNAMHIYDPATNSHEELYPGLIFPYIYTLVWTDGEFIFGAQHNIEMTNGNLLKIDVGERGAAYYGRQ